jgi:tetratricopeptide (TPR) repeat protein
MDAGDTPEERDYRRVALAGSETMLAEALAMAGRFVEALAAGESAVAVAGGTHDPVAQADALGALGNVYSAFGAKDRALAIYQRAAAAVQGDDPESRRARRVHRINEGTALQETGQTGQARRLLEEVLSAVDEEGDSSERIVLRLSLGEACEREGEWAQALRLHAQALALAAGDAGLAAWAKLRLGDALAKRGAESDPGILAKADALLAEALPDIEGAGDPALRMLVRASRGEVALGRGRAAEAVKYASEALRELDAMTGGLADGDIVEARSEADRRRVLTLGIRVAARSGDTGALFEACEQARGRAFVTALGGRRALRRQLLQPAAARRLEQAEAEVTLAYARQREALAAGDVPEAREATRELDATRERCEETLRGVEREARRLLAGPAIGMEKLPETLSRLGSGEALVVYALLPETSKALVLAAGTARCVDLAGQEAIATACAAFPGEDRKVSAETVGEAAGALRSLLVEPLGLPGALRTLTVVPDGVLAHLPWCLLLDRPGDAGPEVVLVPSAGVRTALLSRPRRRGTGRLAIGDPVYTQNEDGRALSVWAGGGQLNALPETAREVEESTGPGDVRLLRESATEAGFARALASRPHWRAVTLSCHGLVNDRNPALSALALTPAPPDDGFLTALEVYALDIPADLVVLSACETARDRAAGGEGVQGLVRAFLLAGAPRVLASLWRIDDAAAREFVVAFHWAFDRPGATTAGALRSAREEVRSRRPHPADWAGWVLWGRPD